MNVSLPNTTISKSSKETVPLASESKGNINFKSIFDAISSKQTAAGFGFDAPLAQITRVRASLEKSKSIEPKELLLYQIQISELNMRVELLSKAADSAMALTRKLQSAQ